MVNDQSRRKFLWTAPLTAAVSFSLTNETFAAIAPAGEGQSAAANAQVPFQVFTAQQIGADFKALEAAPGTNHLVSAKGLGLAVDLLGEKAKINPEFEWHEGREHIVQILDGETVYEVGGAPKNAHSTKPGEWLAPDSEGATKMTLKKGDMLVIPRNTPHRRTTAVGVAFFLISTAPV